MPRVVVGGCDVGTEQHRRPAMHAVVFQVDFVPGREQQHDRELDFVTGMMKSTPGFIHGTWLGDDKRGLSCLLFDSEQAARTVADNAALPPDAAVRFRSADVYAVARDI
jgi:hypothetical protein